MESGKTSGGLTSPGEREHGGDTMSLQTSPRDVLLERGLDRSSRTPTTRSPAMPGEIPGITRFAKVSDALYRGAQPTAEGYVELKKMGVKTVINLRKSSHRDDFRGELEPLGLRCVAIPSRGANPADEEIVKALKILRDPENQPAFVHCKRGKDRTGCVVAVYRMVEQGWRVEEAVDELCVFHFPPKSQIVDYLQNLDVEAIREQTGKVSGSSV